MSKSTKVTLVFCVGLVAVIPLAAYKGREARPKCIDDGVHAFVINGDWEHICLPKPKPPVARPSAP